MQSQAAPYRKRKISSIPVQVNAGADLDSGFLLPRDTTNNLLQKLQAGEITLDKDNASRLSKKQLKKIGIDSPNDVVVKRELDGSFRIFAIYKGLKKGTELGVGSSGKVKLIQDQVTGKYFAFKILSSDTEKSKAQEREKELLALANQLESSVVYQPQSQQGKERYGEQAQGYIMELAPGQPLWAVIGADVSPALRMQAIIDVTAAILEMHKKKIIHCDLKPDNILYDPVTRKVTIIDFSASLIMNENGIAVDTFRGTRVYMPAKQRAALIEALGTKTREEFLAEKFTYSNKTDINNLSLIIASILGLIKQVPQTAADIPHFEIKKDSEAQDAYVQNDKQRRDIIEMLQKMTQDSYPETPDLSAIKDFFASIPVEDEKKITVGLLDVDEYMGTNEEDKKKWLTSLVAYDRIQLISKNEVSDLSVGIVKNELEKEGFAVHDSLISYDNQTKHELIKQLQSGERTSIAMDYLDASLPAPRADKHPQEIKETTITYIPPKVDVENLTPSNKLLGQKTLHSIEERLQSGRLKLGENGVARFTKGELSKLGIVSKYNIIVQKTDHGYDIYAVYKGKKSDKSLGSGTYGSVKIAQNQTTGEFFALKTQKLTLESEINGLKRVGQFILGLIYTPQSKEGLEKYKAPRVEKIAAHAAISTLASGPSLTQYNQASELGHVQMMLDVARTMYNVHQQNILHFDVKPDNIHYDATNRKATFVDFGQSVDSTPNSVLAQGSQVFAAPELRILLNSGGLRPIKPDKSLDIYGLGISYAVALGLAKEIRDPVNNSLHHYELVKETDRQFIHNSKIQDLSIRKDILDLLQRMTSTNITERPTSGKVITEIQDIEKKITSSMAPRQIALIDLKEYENLTRPEKILLANRIKEAGFDEIQPLYSGDQNNANKQQLMIRELEDFGLPIKRSVIHGDTSVTNLALHAAKKDTESKQQYFFIGNQKLDQTRELKERNVHQGYPPRKRSDAFSLRSERIKVDGSRKGSNASRETTRITVPNSDEEKRPLKANPNSFFKQPIKLFNKITAGLQRQTPKRRL